MSSYFSIVVFLVCLLKTQAQEDLTTLLYSSKDSSTLLAYHLSASGNSSLISFDTIIYEFSTSQEQGVLELRTGNPFQWQDVLEISWDSNGCTVLDKHAIGGHFSRVTYKDNQQDYQIIKDACSNTAAEQYQQQQSQKKKSLVFARLLDTKDVPNDMAIVIGKQDATVVRTCLRRDESIAAYDDAEVQLYAHLYNDKEEMARRMLQTSWGDTTPLSAHIYPFGTAVEQLQWEIDLVNQSITIAVQTSFNGFFGIGYGATMTNTDITLIQLLGGAVTVQDSYSHGHFTPSQDAIQNVNLLGYTINSNSLFVKYQRLLNTGDTAQDQIITPDIQVHWITAYVPGADIAIQHSLNTRAQYQFNLCSSCGGMQVSTQQSTNWKKLNQVHRTMLLVGWGYVVDVIVCIGRYSRHIPSLILVHTILAGLLDFLTIIAVAIQLSLNFINLNDKAITAHAVFGIIMLILSILQHINGVFNKFKTIDPLFNDILARIKRGHKAMGITLYFMGKVSVVLGSYAANKVDGNSSTIAQPLIIQICIIIIFRFVPEIIFHQKKKVKQLVVMSKEPDQQKYNASIANETSTKKQQLLKLLNEDRATLQQIRKVLGNYKYAIFQGRVYSLEDFIDHPGGLYLIEQIHGREIDCFLFGGYALETSSRDAYEHSQFAFNLLASMYIGTLDLPENENPVKAQKNQEVGNLARELWKIENQEHLTPTTAKFNLSCPYFKLANFTPGVQWFGRHFTLTSHETGKKRLYTTVTSMTSTNVEARVKLIQYLDGGCNGDEKEFILTPQQQQLSNTLPLVIKRYETAEALSKTIHENQAQQFELSGPHGLGLLLTPQSAGKHIIFTGGTGILPFLDLIDFLLKKVAQGIVQSRKVGVSIDGAGLGIDNCFNDPSFQVVLYAAFADESEILGVDMLRALYKYQSQQQGKALKILFESTIRLANRKSVTGLQTTTQRFDQQFIKSELEKWQPLSRVFVCGPPAMNRDVPAALKALGVDTNLIHYV